MPEVTYEAIRGLLERSQRMDGTLVCQFRCPRTDTTYRGAAPVAPQGGLLSSVRWAMVNVLRGAIGGDGLSETTSGTAVLPPPAPGQESELDADEQAAAVAAFQGLQPPFVWDPEAQQWVSAEAMRELEPRFSRQLQDHPLEALADRKLLARMLVEVAKADDQLDQEEWAFLAKFISPEIGSVDDFMRMPPLAAEDLGQASPGATRETMLMVAWALALTDQVLADGERQQVGSFAAGLGLEGERDEALRGLAQEFIFDQALAAAYPQQRRDAAAHAKLLDETAPALGLSPEEARSIDERYRRRNGIEA